MEKECLDSKIRLLLNITARLPGRRVRQQRPEPAEKFRGSANGMKEVITFIEI